MRLDHDLHLAYCTNIHRGESWVETLANLEQYSLRVRDRVCAAKPYALGLRLSDMAARELSEPATLLAFQRWLERHNCYVFTINGFPYGSFHGTRVKEQVYRPDWTTSERVDYTNRLFDLLAAVLPEDVPGSVSTVPGSFKAFIRTEEQIEAMARNLARSVEHIARLSEKTGHRLQLALEPEPLCFLETSAETVAFFDRLRSRHPNDARLTQHLGVNYDTCHLAVEFEEPGAALDRLLSNEIPISKLHFSSALAVTPTAETRQALRGFADEVYLHQVVVREPDGVLHRYPDLIPALESGGHSETAPEGCEWRIHFHIPLHSQPTPLFGTTTDHLLGVMDRLAADPTLCPHIEMETYTWEVLPEALKQREVIDQLAAEYEWTLAQLARRGLRPV